jgi:hypothetical protein
LPAWIQTIIVIGIALLLCTADNWFWSSADRVGWTGVDPRFFLFEKYFQKKISKLIVELIYSLFLIYQIKIKHHEKF